jgi:hypothetical protein
MLAGTDLRRVENGIDQSRPGSRRQMAGLDVEGRSNLRAAHDLDLGLGHTPPVLVLDGDPGPITFGHGRVPPRGSTVRSRSRRCRTARRPDRLTATAASHDAIRTL